MSFFPISIRDRLLVPAGACPAGRPARLVQWQSDHCGPSCQPSRDAHSGHGLGRQLAPVCGRSAGVRSSACGSEASGLGPALRGRQPGPGEVYVGRARMVVFRYDGHVPLGVDSIKGGQIFRFGLKPHRFTTGRSTFRFYGPGRRQPGWRLRLPIAPGPFAASSELCNRSHRFHRCLVDCPLQLEGGPHRPSRRHTGRDLLRCDEPDRLEHFMLTMWHRMRNRPCSAALLPMPPTFVSNIG